MILISSAAYVEQDLSVEVGRIPPAFLPIGNKRLYEYQVDLLKKYDSEIYLSLPATYELAAHDKKELEALGVHIIFVPEGLTLGNSIVFSWSSSGRQFDNFTILHGDTLYLEHNLQPLDCILVHENEGAYRRGQVQFESTSSNEHYSSDFVDSEKMVISGFFRFSNPPKLIQGILENSGDFVRGVQSYHSNVGLSDITDGEWLDFGHLNSFFNSRSKMTTQRSFNALRIDPRRVTKLSEDKMKMRAESNWFNSIPMPMRLHTPALISDYEEESGVGRYSLEYLYLLPLNDLMVFGHLPDSIWRKIIESAGKIIQDFSSYRSSEINLDDLDKLYLAKTKQRLAEIDSWTFVKGRPEEFNFDSSIALAERASSLISKVNEEQVCIVHGDFCFSNLLYDSRIQSLKLIDPRGLTYDRKLSIYGDRRYDVAKFFHSLIANYDYIIASRYELQDAELVFFKNEKSLFLYEEFERVFSKELGFDMKEIIAINIHLFLSMLPLHSDRPDRQWAMLLNAHRLEKLYLKD